MSHKDMTRWQELVFEHSPFRAVENDDFRSLLEQASDLEKLFLQTPALDDYYAEWSSEAAKPLPTDDTPPTVAKPTAATGHVAAIQLQLMENAFFSLRLDRYANAMDNRGWMNLFRTWAMSPTFDYHFKGLEPTFSRQFTDFYLAYIKGWDLDAQVPHPWDVQARTDVPLFSGATQKAIERCRKMKGKGIFLDPGLVEAGQRGAYKEPTRVQEGQHGVGAERATSSTEAASGATAAEDSSRSTD